MNKITVIIPFLNEGEEIERTVRNIRDTADGNVDILLVNDASTDEFDYESVAKAFHAGYLKNEKRCGVAKSRGIGVSEIKTPYFILLDGHMRFYSNDWWRVVESHVESDDRAIYCLKCLVLDSQGNIVENRFGVGGYVKLSNEPVGSLLDAAWIISGNGEMFEAPCIFGASYIMSKRYWDYIKGLEGLRYYGMDETYLSLKVWLEGGSCKVLPDIEVGHIFRTKAPYCIINADIFYNKLLITETVLPDDYAPYVHTCLESFDRTFYYLALSLLNRQKDEIAGLKTYYQSIFTRDFSFFRKINSRFTKSSKPYFHTANIDSKLDEIAMSLSREISVSDGLMAGKTGELVFLCEYSRYKNSRNFDTLINNTLQSIADNITKEKPCLLNLATGLAGQGTGLIYLKNRGFTDMNLSPVMKIIDKKLLGYASDEINRQNFGYIRGIAGAGAYFVKRKLTYHVNYLISEMERAFETIENLPPDMSCGMLGVLQFFLFACEVSTDKEKIKKLVRRLVSRILSCEPKFNERGLGWNSGDLISGYVLLMASGILNDEELRKESMHKLVTTAKRQDAVVENVWDAGFYHGSSGVAYLYHKLFHLTGETVFSETRKYWMEETLFKAVACNDNAGYISSETNAKVNNKGLLAGIAGIGLALLSIKTESYFPDDFFLLKP
jgi:glycosyltransferase involved in cell wall biosynthesis